MKDSARYAELFLTESRDNLVAVNEALLRLERDARDSAAIDAAFRAVHTIKGMAGVMGYGAVSDLAHDMEALLAGARDEQRGLRSDDPPLLFEAADALEAAIEASVAGRSAEVDVNAVCARLRGWATGMHAVPATVGEFLLPPGEGLGVTVTLAREAPLRGARAMIVLQRARTLGHVVSVVPEERALAEDLFEHTFAFRLKTNASQELIAETLKAAGHVESVRVARESHGADPAAASVDRADSAWTASTIKAPLQRYVRIDLRRLDALMNLMGELVIARGRLDQSVARHNDSALQDAAGAVSRLIGEMQTGILSSRMVPVWQVFDRFPRVVRDAARSLGKELDFTVEGREIELDRALLDQIGDPLVHLLRNAIDHGIEDPAQRVAAGKEPAGKLTLSAARDRSSVVIRVTDDGRGIDRARMLARGQSEGILDPARTELSDEDLLRMIARPGFSTAERVTTLSGRGVGVDAVVSRVRSIGGSVELRTALGKGTSITIRLPVTLAIIQALLARVGDETYALPLTHVRETLQLTPSVVRRVRGNDVLVLRDEVLPLLNLRQIVALPVRDPEGSQVVVLEVADRRAGLVVDQLRGQQEIVVKPIDGARGAASCFSGATILGDGVPALILEATSLL
jgi:two-component system, chemotaxis family, sensor kinase CheA